MTKKGYKDLKREVWDAGICSRCGGCIAVCPADALFFDNKGVTTSPTHPESTEYCKMEVDGVPCGACYEACPRTSEGPGFRDTLLGDYLEILAGRATFPIKRKQSGGAVTALLSNALDEGLIDAVVTVTEDHWTLKPASALISSSDVLVEHAGSRYNWWVPLLAALKEAIFVRKYRRIAVVGVPCAVSAVRRIQKSHLDLHRPFANSIRLIVGLFCTESFDYNLLVEGKLRHEHHIDPWEIRGFDVKGKLEIFLVNGETLVIPLTDLENCIPSGCLTCTDFTALDADISAGAVGTPEGYTTLIVRTPVGGGFVEHAIENGMLETGNQISVGQIERLSEKKLKRTIIT